MSDTVVKSAARVLEVFEFFAGRKTPATVGEVCASLRYPQSSTSVLLKSLLTLGYLSYDGNTRRYAPSEKVARLGNWIVCAAEIEASVHGASDQPAQIAAV